ncbi:response regulator transcription factor [Micromonospora aurantiaca]|uniref:response regulator n=1 Tax=Micromonospora TaxID=1873 RepID=UPI0008D9DE81|nr:response regulator transcription factor [Micromonospora sp. WMMB235]OHX07115.1 DNA-binding response regulator [Micromonospora sp. WMMB235]
MKIDSRSEPDSTSPAMGSPVGHVRPTTLMIVDGHDLIRHGVRQILETEQDLSVVAEAGDSVTAVTVSTAVRPDVVVLDIEIPGGDPVGTVRRIREGSPDTAVIILSMLDGPELVRDLLEVGVRGYLHKSVARHDLVSAVRAVSRDRARVVLGVSRSSLDHVYGRRDEVLSPRELEVLAATAEGLSNAQIATRLSLAETTVKRHLRNIFAKLSAVSRIDAVNKAVAASIIQPPGARNSSRPGLVAGAVRPFRSRTKN